MTHVLKVCRKCKATKPISDYFSGSRYCDGKHPYCKKCVSTYSVNSQKKRRLSDPQYRLWQSSYANAHSKGVPHTIKPSDIPLPTHCIYLSCVLDYTFTRKNTDPKNPHCASIDRIDPSLGYVPGNVQVISDLANRMKSNATIEQLVEFARGVLTVHS